MHRQVSSCFVNLPPGLRIVSCTTSLTRSYVHSGLFAYDATVFMRGWRTNRLFEPSCMLHDIAPGLRIMGNILLVEQHLVHSLSGGMLSIIVYFSCESVARTCCDFSTHDFFACLMYVGLNTV